MVEDARTYDVAVSFSGRQRDYVERVVRACEALGVRVFYDQNETVRLWGTNVIPELRKIYGGEAARYVIPFLSRDYLAGAYPMDEFHSAITAGVRRGDDYLLPVLMDDTEIPGELLNPAIIYLHADDHTPEQLARAIATKVAAGTGGTGKPRQARLPKIAPVAFDRRGVLDAALTQVGALFKEESGGLADYGYTAQVRATETAVKVLVEKQGDAVCELLLRQGEPFWTDRLTVAFAWPRIVGSGVGGTVTANWDADLGQAVLVYDDFSRPGLADRPLNDAGELFTALWEKILRVLESHVR
jgi:hypothetical protein